MAKSVFFSFHFANDAWRAGQVRNIGAIEANRPVSDNEWETVKRGGDAAIERWIAGQMAYKSCCVVLVGSQTASRPWVRHEIEYAWEKGKGVVGIRVHGLKDANGSQGTAGASPFAGLTVGGRALASIVQLYDPPSWSSTDVYADIEANIGRLVDEAVNLRRYY